MLFSAYFFGELLNNVIKIISIFCSHYFVHGGFLDTDDQLLKGIDTIRHIPTTLVQGRYDLQCPMETAWKLHKVGSNMSCSCHCNAGCIPFRPIEQDGCLANI